MGNTIMMHFMVFAAFESRIQALKNERILSHCGDLSPDLSPHRIALGFLKPCIVKILSLLYKEDVL